MSDRGQNPYATPSAELVTGAALASRGARLGAAILDALIVGVINVSILYNVGWFSLDGGAPDSSDQLAAALVGLVLFLLLNGYFLATRGQSLGKMAVGVRIVDHATGELAPVSKIVLLRILPFTLVQVVHPIIGPLAALVDVLFIFGDSRRCLHDRLAGTSVVDARARVDPGQAIEARAVEDPD